ncbi:MAG: acyl--CoA ligase, partial [Thermoguttaceae bacterium]|nr:acyl--CoA ligase [Thermoguttaceae bacterium]
MWQDSVANYSNNVALVDDGKEYTYGQLDAAVASFRAILSQNGVKPGDVVGMYLPNCADFVKAYLALTTMGACAVLLPPHLDNMTVFGCSMMFGMKALVYSNSLAEKLDVVKAKNPTLPLIEGGSTCDQSMAAIPCPPESTCTVLFTGGTTGKSKGARLSQ